MAHLCTIHSLHITAPHSEMDTLNPIVGGHQITIPEIDESTTVLVPGNMDCVCYQEFCNLINNSHSIQEQIPAYKQAIWLPYLDLKPKPLKFQKLKIL